MIELENWDELRHIEIIFAGPDLCDASAGVWLHPDPGGPAGLRQSRQPSGRKNFRGTCGCHSFNTGETSDMKLNWEHLT